MAQSHGIIRTIYLYLFALVGLFVFVFGAVNGVSATLDRYVFPQDFVNYEVRPVTPDEKNPTLTEEEQKQNFERQQDNDFRRRMNGAIPSIIIGYLLWAFHWREIKKDREIN
jgi:hypothetical protein